MEVCKKVSARTNEQFKETIYRLLHYFYIISVQFRSVLSISDHVVLLVLFFFFFYFLSLSLLNLNPWPV